MIYDFTASVLVVSQTEKACTFIKSILPQSQFQPIQSVHSAGEAKRAMIDKNIDLVIINAPLKEEYGAKLAENLSQNYGCSVLIMVAAEMYEQISYEVEDYGVWTVSRPCTSNDVFRSVKLMMATRAKIRAYEEKSASLEQKMKEIRLVNRAKALLQEHMSMTEAEAHRYIEKAAMDNCKKKSEMAENIIELYGSL